MAMAVVIAGLILVMFAASSEAVLSGLGFGIMGLGLMYLGLKLMPDDDSM